MKRLRSKILLFLVIYALGMASGVYLSLPGDETDCMAAGDSSAEGFITSAIRSDELAKSLRAGIDRCTEAAKLASAEAGKAISKQIASIREAAD